MRRAHEHAVGHVGPLNVGDIIAAAGNEAPIFLAQRSGADPDALTMVILPAGVHGRGARETEATMFW